MKKYILLLLILIADTAFSKGADDLFTSTQKNDILRQIDNVCADTWCEGDYNFKFNEFTCDKERKTCELNFQFIKYDDNNTEILSSIKFCHFEKIKSYRQLMESKHQLNENFYDDLSDCISDLEGSLE